VRDVLRQSGTYHERVRVWTRTLASTPPTLGPPPDKTPKDTTCLDDIKRLRERLVDDGPRALATTAPAIAQSAAPLLTERRRTESAIRTIVTTATELYGARLMRHASIALRVTDSDLSRAEDVMSEVWIAFIDHLPNFRGGSSLYTYLRTILDHVLLRYGVDYTKRADDVIIGQDGEAGELDLADPNDALAVLDSQDDKEEVAKALMALEVANQRQFRRICLYYFLGLEAQRIAKLEGITPGGMQKGISDARAALKMHLGTAAGTKVRS